MLRCPVKTLYEFSQLDDDTKKPEAGKNSVTDFDKILPLLSTLNFIEVFLTTALPMTTHERC
jgi:hypothetical protein